MRGKYCSHEEYSKIWWPMPLFFTYFGFIQYIGLRVHKTYIIFCLGFALWMTGSLLAEELSCCDCC
jgi:hypothetical protein